jgi:N-acetylmuramoyl-L-alanine amidase
MPAVLAEISCMSNVDEARLLATPEYRAALARALHAGIRRIVEPDAPAGLSAAKGVS